MQDNASTDNADTQTRELDIDREDWELAFEPLEKNSYPVLKLGFIFAILRKHLDTQLIKPRPVMDALDQAMEVLFPLTQFHDVSFNLFLKYAEGNSPLKKNRC